MENLNREIKSSLFVDLFQNCENAKENFLSLYNALHGTNLKLEETEIIPNKLDKVIYMNHENDVSMLINGKLIVLVEHQSTINENMPLRFLLYVSRIYERMIPLKKRYYKSLQKIPTPEFYVLYNGKQDFPNEKLLKLSDAFLEKTTTSSLELTVKIMNINCSRTKNPELPVLKNCSILKEYSEFIEIARELAPDNNPDSIKKAIQMAIKAGILKEYLEKHSSEVMNMLIADYSYEEDVAAQREEAFELGEKKGIQQGASQAKLEAAVNLYKNGVSFEIIEKSTGITKEQIMAALS